MYLLVLATALSCSLVCGQGLVNCVAILARGAKRAKRLKENSALMSLSCQTKVINYRSCLTPFIPWTSHGRKTDLCLFTVTGFLSLRLPAMPVRLKILFTFKTVTLLKKKNCFWGDLLDTFFLIASCLLIKFEYPRHAEDMFINHICEGFYPWKTNFHSLGVIPPLLRVHIFKELFLKYVDFKILTIKSPSNGDIVGNEQFACNAKRKGSICEKMGS